MMGQAAHKDGSKLTLVKQQQSARLQWLYDSSGGLLPNFRTTEVCHEYWSDFQSSWCWGPTESQKRAGTRSMIAVCFPSCTTRSPATSYTASTPRMHRATSGSSYHGLLISLQYVLPHIFHSAAYTEAANTDVDR